MLCFIRYEYTELELVYLYPYKISISVSVHGSLALKQSTSMASPRRTTGTPSNGTLVAAYLIVCVVWGSTFLAIRWGLETLPPFTMAGIRYLVAGGTLFGWQRLRGAERPTRRHWREAAIIGTLMLCGANGLVCWGEQFVPSGIAALIVSTIPVFIVVFDAVWFKRTQLTPRVGAGLFISLMGVSWLTGVWSGSWQFDLRGLAALVAAPVFWAIGSLRARGAQVNQDAFLGTAMQMLAGGIALLLVALSIGESFHPAKVSMRSFLALVYMIVFGSIIAYSAYCLLLRFGRAGPASTYALVNPVIAVVLGWTMGQEQVGLRTIVAGCLILVGVALIRTSDSTDAKRPRERARQRNGKRKEEEMHRIVRPGGGGVPADTHPSSDPVHPGLSTPGATLFAQEAAECESSNPSATPSHRPGRHSLCGYRDQSCN